MNILSLFVYLFVYLFVCLYVCYIFCMSVVFRILKYELAMEFYLMHTSQAILQNSPPLTHPSFLEIFNLFPTMYILYKGCKIQKAVTLESIELFSTMG